MSVKDTRYKRQCPICTSTLAGTDDAVMVFECLKETVEEIDAGKACESDLGCTLCGESCTLAEARKIINKGEPVLQNAEEGEFDDDDVFHPCMKCGDEHPEGVLEDGHCPPCCDDEED